MLIIIDVTNKIHLKYCVKEISFTHSSLCGNNRYNFQYIFYIDHILIKFHLRVSYSFRMRANVALNNCIFFKDL